MQWLFKHFKVQNASQLFEVLKFTMFNDFQETNISAC